MKEAWSFTRTMQMWRRHLILVCTIASALGSQEPNILWITSEDNSASWLGCYGNRQAHTPQLDKLAADGLRFTRAYANAPVCAVARSILLNGRHAVSQGTHHMRSRYPVAPDIVPYVTALRAAGYHCTNRSKTDYNFRGLDSALWDECSHNAHYRKRPEGRPFLSVVNLTISHESSIFTENARSHPHQDRLARKFRLDPRSLELPPYLPDLPDIRADMAAYHDKITALDQEVGHLLAELEAQGLAVDTIVLYQSDHGGVLPRSKRYLEDSGTRVPLIIRIPATWRHLSPFSSGTNVDELVSFVDLAPTLLSLAGIANIPSTMQGRAVLGPLRTAPPAHPIVYLSADRFDEIPGMRRGITDGVWKYIRCFTPQLPAAPCSSYSFGQAGWRAWQTAWKNDRLDPRHRALWEAPQPVELLYNLTRDPHEVHNLAGHPDHSAQLAAMRTRLRAEMILHRDAGLVPEPVIASISEKKPVERYLYDYREQFPLLVDLALLSGVAKAQDLPNLRTHLKSPDPLVRYWAAHVAATTPDLAASLLAELRMLLDDSEASVRVVAAGILWNHEPRGEAKARLLRELDSYPPEALTLSILALLEAHDALWDVSDSWIGRTLRENHAMDPYPRRVAQRLRDARKGGGKPP